MAVSLPITAHTNLNTTSDNCKWRFSELQVRQYRDLDFREMRRHGDNARKEHVDLRENGNAARVVKLRRSIGQLPVQEGFVG